MSAFRLLYSFWGSLFFRWSFFLYAASSAVSGCFGVFQSVTRSDLRFPFTTGSPVGASPFSFLFAPSALPRVASSGIFVIFSLVFILLSVSGFRSLPCLFAWIRYSFSVVGNISLLLFFAFRLPGVTVMGILFSALRFRRLLLSYCISGVPCLFLFLTLLPTAPC